MSWLKKAVSTTANATSAVVSTTASAVSNTGNIVTSAIHNPGKVDTSVDWSDRVNPIPQLCNIARGGLKFRFASDEGKVLIYAEWNLYNLNHQISFLKFNEGTVMKRVQCIDYRYVPYKEHVIKHRTYKEIIEFVKKYISNNEANSFISKTREFAIRLAEFCGVSISEIDGKYTLGLKAASQMYTVNDTIKGVSTGINKVIVDKKPVRGTAHVIGSVAQNAAKFGVATVKSAAHQNVSTVPNTISDVVNGRNQDDEKYLVHAHINYINNTNHNIETNANNDGGIKSNNKVVGGNIEGDDCPICYANGKSHAMQCGHILCWDCIQKVDECPFCKEKKKGVVKLFNLKDED